jgi:hypothetical protein
MLLLRKTAALGAAVILPVMANILMINVFFSIAWGALCTSTFIFAAVLALLWRDRLAIVSVFWTQQGGEPASVRRTHLKIAALVVLLVIAQMGVALWLQAVKS